MYENSTTQIGLSIDFYGNEIQNDNKTDNIVISSGIEDALVREYLIKRGYNKALSELEKERAKTKIES